jgi:hypothetical protein
VQIYFWLCEIFIVGRSHETTSHNTSVFDLTYFSRSQRSNSINWPFVSGPHISVKIDARLLIFWWYDGHIVPLCLLALSMIFDLRCAPIGGTF